MKLIIEIPEKTNAHIRSDYGHGVKGLEYEDMLMLCDAVYHGEPYHNRPHGEWIVDKILGTVKCPKCSCEIVPNDMLNGEANFCPNCGADMRGKAE